MTYRGYVKNGQITLDEDEHLPEGAQVTIEVLNGSENGSVRDRHEILRMSLESRRQLLMKQSEKLAAHYDSEGDRSEWQGGDIVE